ncbi:OmpH family outer membrane protein [Acinetobacter faecalis]|uniref:OmpH family outer membrane protein n=1 Tax=Acinetobacter faecalis TaxID=2665161 RepID=UPI002A9168D6|nr:OmpH family outer membrane protein [Acinetobacter faecalis]MDY6488138.1 OmpH family outer membrane protein [Acinetobacter faecalis]
MKKVLLALASGLAFTAVQAADYGIVDIDKVVQGSAYLKQQQSALQQSIKPQTTQIEQLQKDLAGIQQKRNAAKSQAEVDKLKKDFDTKAAQSQAEVDKLKKDFDTKAAQVNTLQQQVQSKVQTTMQATNTVFETRVKTAAEQLRKENKLDLVLNKNSVLASDSSADLTDKIIQKVNAIK